MSSCRLRSSEFAHPEPGQCLLCDRNRRTACCEHLQQLATGSADTKLAKVLRTSRRAKIVCKDCCISDLDGHRCPWWRFCWDI